MSVILTRSPVFSAIFHQFSKMQASMKFAYLEFRNALGTFRGKKYEVKIISNVLKEGFYIIK